MKKTNLFLRFGAAMLCLGMLTGCVIPPLEETPDGYVDDGVHPNYGGRTFSTWVADDKPGETYTSSMFLFKPSDTVTDAVSSAVYDRNRYVERTLNIHLSWTPGDVDYNNLQERILQIWNAGGEGYHLVINDLFPLASMSVEPYFYNLAGNENLKTEEKYWYSEYMRSVSLSDNYTYILAGDFFTDILRTAHCLIFNKNIYRSMFGEPNELYTKVQRGDWTMDEFLSLVSQAFINKGTSEARDLSDQYGFLAEQMWGTMIPFLNTVDNNCVLWDRGGTPYLNLENERSEKLVAQLVRLYHDKASRYDGYKATTASDMFRSELGLFLGGQQLGSLESFRADEVDYGILPYPKMDELQKDYITSTHDTTEIGVVLSTVKDISFVTTVLEMLNAVTAEQVYPLYYEKSLKVMGSRAETDAVMVTLIHDHMGSAFMLAYSYALDGVFGFETFYKVVQKKGTLASTAAKLQPGAQQKLDEIITAFKTV